MPNILRNRRVVLAGGGFSPTSAESAAFLARTSGLSDARKRAYDTMITGLVSDGVFSKLDALYMFATNTSTHALLSLVSATYNATNTGSSTFTADAGFTGNGSSMHIDSNFNPSTASSPKYVRNSASLFVWCNTSAQSAIAMTGALTANITAVYPRFTDDKAYFLLNVSSDYSTNTANSDGKGFYAVNRSASNAVQSYINGSAGPTNTSASVAVNNSNLVFLGGDGVAYNAGQAMAGGFGQSLTGTEHGNLHSRVHTYLQTIAGIP